MIKNTDTVAHWMAIAASERMLRFEAKEREQIAIESFDEERQRVNRLAEPVWAELVAHLNPQPVSAP